MVAAGLPCAAEDFDQASLGKAVAGRVRTRPAQPEIPSGRAMAARPRAPSWQRCGGQAALTQAYSGRRAASSG